MRKTIGIVSFLILFWAIPSQATPIKLIFYYPGGQGSPEQAQPILDEFSAALAKASDGKLQTAVTYISDPNEGETYIQNQKPAAGILALDVFLANKSSWNAEVIAKTLQLPNADGTDRYYLLGNKNETLPVSGKITILASRPLEKSFLQNKLFSQLGERLRLKVTLNPVGELRKIGMGKESAYVLLNQFEYSMISRLKTDWAQNLKVLAESPKISSAPFVVFATNISPEDKAELQQALIKLSKDSKAKETLKLLRLKGFQRATSVSP